MCRIIDVIVFLFLLVCSVSDIRTQKISTRLLISMSVFLLIFRLTVGNASILSAAGGVLIGVLFVLISKLTKEEIGYGDSWIILLLGGYLGIEKLFLLLITAFFFAGICSLAGLAWKKWNRRYAIPFVPFLTLAYAGVVFV